MIGSLASVALALAHAQPMPPPIYIEATKWGDRGQFQVTIRNTTNTDLNLNLGITIANSKLMRPTNLRLLVEREGKSSNALVQKWHYVGQAQPIGGRIDDFIVPLMVGSSYQMVLSLADFSSLGKDSREPGSLYKVTVVLESGSASHINGDMEGVKYINLWKGTRKSNQIELTYSLKP